MFAVLGDRAAEWALMLIRNSAACAEATDAVGLTPHCCSDGCTYCKTLRVHGGHAYVVTRTHTHTRTWCIHVWWVCSCFLCDHFSLRQPPLLTWKTRWEADFTLHRQHQWASTRGRCGPQHSLGMKPGNLITDTPRVTLGHFQLAVFILGCSSSRERGSLKAHCDHGNARPHHRLITLPTPKQTWPQTEGWPERFYRLSLIFLVSCMKCEHLKSTDQLRRPAISSGPQTFSL